MPTDGLAQVSVPPMPSQPRVAIMILSYNGLRWLGDCLESVLSTDYPNYEVYLVDNGSVDGSVGYVRRDFRKVKIIESATNLGFAHAYNKAIRQVHADYIVLLNQDTKVVARDWLQELVNTARHDASKAAVACKMVSMRDYTVLDSVGGMGIPFWRGFVDIGRDMADRGRFDVGPFEPFAFCGGAALLNRAAFIRAGGFDSKFFLYVEDADLSWRLRLLCYSISYVPKAVVAHQFSSSTGGTTVTPEKLYYSHRNLLRSILKNCGRPTLPWAICNYFLFSLLLALGFGLLEPEKTRSIVRGIFWNFLNFRDTYGWRRKIQASRKIEDAEILRSMYPSIERHQSKEHLQLRHILNILFEYSQRRALMPKDGR